MYSTYTDSCNVFIVPASVDDTEVVLQYLHRQLYVDRIEVAFTVYGSVDRYRDSVDMRLVFIVEAIVDVDLLFTLQMIVQMWI